MEILLVLLLKLNREDDFNHLLKVDLKYISILLHGVMEREWHR